MGLTSAGTVVVAVLAAKRSTKKRREADKRSRPADSKKVPDGNPLPGYPVMGAGTDLAKPERGDEGQAELSVTARPPRDAPARGANRSWPLTSVRHLRLRLATKERTPRRVRSQAIPAVPATTGIVINCNRRRRPPGRAIAAMISVKARAIRPAATA